ncbi:MAG: S26 family signal peptidase [Chloroflexota bacterium]|nr:S26 family signal peptidase [Chloroflexota bacterium]
MSNPPFNTPHLYTLSADALPLSGFTLLKLMQAVLAKDVPFRFRAKGGSMAPFIHDGDLITVTPFQNKPPGIGEVLAFIHPDIKKLVIHRAVAKCDSGLWIQGDSVDVTSNGVVPLKNLLGRVTCIERGSHRVWLGLGLERFFIAWLSRLGLLIPVNQWLLHCRQFFTRRMELI